MGKKQQTPAGSADAAGQPPSIEGILEQIKANTKTIYAVVVTIVACMLLFEVVLVKYVVNAEWIDKQLHISETVLKESLHPS